MAGPKATVLTLPMLPAWECRWGRSVLWASAGTPRVRAAVERPSFYC